MKFAASKFTMLAVVIFFALPLMAQEPATAAAPTPGRPVRVITIRAKKYEFIPSEITLKKDQTVKLELSSEDVEHSLEVRGLGINGIMKKGEVTDVIVTPTKIGDYKGKCGKFCGFGHGRMHFLVHVVP